MGYQRRVHGHRRFRGIRVGEEAVRTLSSALKGRQGACCEAKKTAMGRSSALHMRRSGSNTHNIYFASCSEEVRARRETCTADVYRPLRSIGPRGSAPPSHVRRKIVST